MKTGFLKTSFKISLISHIAKKIIFSMMSIVNLLTLKLSGKHNREILNLIIKKKLKNLGNISRVRAIKQLKIIKEY